MRTRNPHARRNTPCEQGKNRGWVTGDARNPHGCAAFVYLRISADTPLTGDFASEGRIWMNIQMDAIADTPCALLTGREQGTKRARAGILAATRA